MYLHLLKISFPPFVFFFKLSISFNTFKMRFQNHKAKLKLGKIVMKHFFIYAPICNVHVLYNNEMYTDLSLTLVFVAVSHG